MHKNYYIIVVQQFFSFCFKLSSLIVAQILRTSLICPETGLMLTSTDTYSVTTGIKTVTCLKIQLTRSSKSSPTQTHPLRQYLNNPNSA